MRKVLSLSVAGLALVLGGCVAGSSSVAMKSTSSSSYADDVDYVKMNQVSRDASMRGYRIVWINPPQKQLDKKVQRGG